MIQSFNVKVTRSDGKISGKLKMGLLDNFLDSTKFVPNHAVSVGSSYI